MKKHFFRFNEETLRYEGFSLRNLPGARKFLLPLIGLSVLSGALLATAVFLLFSTPEEYAMKQRQKNMRKKVGRISARLEQSEKLLQDIAKREKTLYRQVFNTQAKFQHAEVYKKPPHVIPRNLSQMVEQTSSRLNRLESSLGMHERMLSTFHRLYKERKERISHTPAIPPVDKSVLKHPPYGFGPRTDPVYGTQAFHEGMDFTAEQGTPVYATAEGTIREAGYNPGGYGKKVVIDHGYGYRTLYAHLSKILVKRNQEVKRGQKIGLIGNTGKSVAPHLHYEVHKQNRPVNPVYYYYNDLTASEYKRLIKKANALKTSLD